MQCSSSRCECSATLTSGFRSLMPSFTAEKVSTGESHTLHTLLQGLLIECITPTPRLYIVSNSLLFPHRSSHHSPLTALHTDLNHSTSKSLNSVSLSTSSLSLSAALHTVRDTVKYNRTGALQMRARRRQEMKFNKYRNILRSARIHCVVSFWISVSSVTEWRAQRREHRVESTE